MPIFDFQCAKCKIVEEHLVKGDLYPNFECPKCERVLDKLTSIPKMLSDGDGISLNGRRLHNFCHE